jgi:DNA-binding CsgD family transcriptional regulator
MNAAELRKVAAAFVNAAFDPAEWRQSLHRLAMAADATGVVLLPLKGRVPGVPHSEGIAELVDSYFRAGWHLREERALGIPALMRKGIMVDQDFISPEAVNRSAYYQEFVIATGFRWFAGVGFGADDDIWVAAIQRTAKQGPFTEPEQRKLLCIRSQLSTAATLARRFGHARIEGMATALEATGSAFLFVNRMGRIVAANRKAEALIAGTLRIAGGELIAARREDTAAIERQIALATGAAGTGAGSPPEAILVSRPDRRGLILRAVPLPPQIRDSFAPAVAMILIADPEEEAKSPENLLRQHLGLTQAEAAMTRWLAEGRSVEDFAGSKMIATSTARQLCKQVLAKTGTHRQSQLVALVKDLEAAVCKVGG